jgi:hypothetical protein
MYLATTDSFATGAKTAVSIDHLGHVVVTRGNLTSAGLISSNANNGFANATYYTGVRNPIWSFGNANAYGISYFQGTAGLDSTDTIGIHPNGTATAAGSIFSVTNAYSRSLGSLRAPIFYDSNDTNYYADPTSVSSLNQVVANRIILDRNYGHSIFGTYSSYRYQGVWSMGQSWYLPDDGTTTGNLYGLAWSHPNAGGVAGNLNTHGLLVLENGGFLAAISGSIRSRDDMRSPIFYDNNDTYYRIDGNNGSQLASVYANNWFRPQGGCGVYWESYGRGVRASDSEYSYGNIGTYGGGLNGWRGYGIYPNNAILMANGSTVGIHNPQWGWVFQSDMNGNVTWGGNVTAYSDLRLKDNVREIDNVITRRDTLAKAAIKYERDGRTRVGYGAQILRDNGCSEFVLEADDALKLTTGLGTLSVDYGETAAVLAVVSKMTDDKVSILENKVEELTRLIQQLIGD